MDRFAKAHNTQCAPELFLRVFSCRISGCTTEDLLKNRPDRTDHAQDRLLRLHLQSDQLHGPCRGVLRFVLRVRGRGRQLADYEECLFLLPPMNRFAEPQDSLCAERSEEHDLRLPHAHRAGG